MDERLERISVHDITPGMKIEVRLRGMANGSGDIITDSGATMSWIHKDMEIYRVVKVIEISGEG